MKHMKRIFALALAIVMAMSLATVAFAAEGDKTYSITITAPEGASLTNHTYAVYQIFTGELSTNEAGKTVLSNVKYGQNYGTLGEEVPESVLTALAGMSGAAAAEDLNGKKTGTAYATLPDGNSWTVTAPAGYYLIVDTSTNLPQGETSSAFILQLVEDVEVKSKHSAGPKVEKKIDDTNDSTEATNEIEWHDSADHDIGDAIPFKLEMTVPGNFAQFVEYGEAYKFVFHDKEEQGLTFNNDAKVYVDGTLITSGYTVVTSPEDGDTFDVVFADLTKVTGVKVGSVISVVYTSTLNQSAILGSQGNVNKVYGEYSNLHRPEYPGRTPDDTVIAFTYKVIVNKVDEKGEALEGAKFTLEKYDAATGKWVAISQVETEPGTVFTFKGLDDGKYRLTETETPAGYNTIKPIEFTVTADHDILWETQGRTDVLNSLTGDAATGEVESGEKEITFTPSASEGSLTTKVENKSGTVLPETGGMGTTIFYTLGGIMVLAAVVLLVTKKRMASAE